VIGSSHVYARRVRFRRWPLVLLVLVVCGFPSGVHASSCGDYPEKIVDRIKAQGVSCSFARRLAGRYVGIARCYQRGCTLQGFRCARAREGYESYVAVCRGRSAQKITFHYGA